jgi:pSer/pThr/pTyr-binding forkhead associated (FHA) protein
MGTLAARFEVVSGKAAGMSILVEDELLIGRQADGAGRLAEDDEISRNHARVTVDASGLYAVEDLGSTNGTFVNGQRVSGSRTLEVGDTIELGQTKLVVRELPVTPASVGPGRKTTVVPRPDQVAPLEELRPAPGESPMSPAPEPAVPPPPPLSLRLELDYTTREARVFLADGTEPVRLVCEAGAWRPITVPSTEEGGANEPRPTDP